MKKDSLIKLSFVCMHLISKIARKNVLYEKITFRLSEVERKKTFQSPVLFPRADAVGNH